VSGVIDRLNAALEGRYRIERELGQGGMATVFLAEDLKHDRKVALKVLKPELAAVVGAERFLAEIRTTANLQHPNILPLFDSGEADSFLFYVMPYVEGESLREKLDREKQLHVDEAVGIATEVAEALHAAHGQGIIHRDIKPANILLSSGRPLVADFGIALAVTQAGGERITETGLSLGTPYYMSPEQATGDRVPTAASDVYGLGCVLYEMLTGEPPHTGSTAQAVLGKILLGSPTRATELRPAIPVHIDSALLKALEKLPADRFDSAAEFAPAVSPDGRWLAYVSDVSGTLEVFVRPFADRGGSRTQVSSGGGVGPVWTPAGDELIYVEPAAGMLWVAGVDAAGTFRITSRDALFSLLNRAWARDVFGRMLDVGPDGQEILVVFLGGATSADATSVVEDPFRYIMVQNWFTELGAQMRAAERRAR
jgi:serine/threonine protein kinase